MLSTYLSFIQQQRINNPRYPKDYRVNPLPRLLTSSNESIKELKTRPNAVFCGIISRDIPRYSDTEDIYYYEFVNLSLRTRTSFADWEYWYIPVSKYDELVAAIGKDRIPSYKVYNVQTTTIDTILTKSQPLIPFVRPASTFSTGSYTDNLHPLLPNFIYTGHSFLDKKGFMIYEYQDYKMFSDDITVTYYSVMRPLNFFIKNSVAADYALEIDTNLLKLLESPPGYLELYTDLPDLRATARATTQDFSSVRKWYEYTRYVNGQPFNKILLPYAPTSLSIDFVKLELNNSSMALNFNQVNNTQALSINQTSSNNKISL